MQAQWPPWRSSVWPGSAITPSRRARRCGCLFSVVAGRGTCGPCCRSRSPRPPAVMTSWSPAPPCTRGWCERGPPVRAEPTGRRARARAAAGRRHGARAPRAADELRGPDGARAGSPRCCRCARGTARRDRPRRGRLGALIVAERLGLPYATVLVDAAGGLMRRSGLGAPLDALRAEHGLPPRSRPGRARPPSRALALSAEPARPGRPAAATAHGFHAAGRPARRRR